MKLSWNEAKPYFEEHLVWTHGLAIHWYEYAWGLVEKSGLNTYNSIVEKLAVYSRLHATIQMYMEFCQAGFEESPDFYLDIELETKYEEEYEVYRALIEDSDTMHTIAGLLRQEKDKKFAFWAMWITCQPGDAGEDMDFEDITTYEEYIKSLDNVMNYDITFDKMAAYSWFDNLM